MRGKNEGFTLVEVIVYMAIISTFFFISVEGIRFRKEKEVLKAERIKISQFIRKAQQKAQNNQSDKKEYILDFKITENKIYMLEDTKNKKMVDKIKLSPEISYMTNNKGGKKLDFNRKITSDGNFEKGFTIYLMNKKGDKIYYKVSVNTINVAKYPIISVYKAKKPLGLNEDYVDENMWTEEI